LRQRLSLRLPRGCFRVEFGRQDRRCETRGDIVLMLVFFFRDLQVLLDCLEGSERDLGEILGVGSQLPGVPLSLRGL
jgi:hypothetical protein